MNLIKKLVGGLKALQNKTAALQMVVAAQMMFFASSAQALTITAVLQQAQDGLGAWILKSLMVIGFVIHMIVSIVMPLFKGEYDNLKTSAAISLVMLTVILTYDAIISGIVSALGGA